MREQANYAMFVSPTCGFCGRAEELLAKEIKSGKVELIDIATPDGRAAALRHGVTRIPHLVKKSELLLE